MLQTLLCRIGIVKKLIVLSIPAYYPAWHSRYGEKTLFATRLISGRHFKKHVFKQDIKMWRKIARKFATGRYELHICYRLRESGPGKYVFIMRGSSLHIQTACFPENDTDHLLIDGRAVPLELVAVNEGVSEEDLLELKRYCKSTDFCIVHFTDYNY